MTVTDADTDTMPPEPYSVLPYSPDALVRQVALASNQGDAAGQQLGRKPHLSYLHDYLGALAARTILVERGYIDRHYTEDHSEYYVRCFRDYRKTCTRLHFFSRVFDGGDFTALLNKEGSPIDADILQESYLGFVVVKPLPVTVIPIKKPSTQAACGLAPKPRLVNHSRPGAHLGESRK